MTLKPVPPELRLGLERFYIWIAQGDRCWKLGIQLRLAEALSLVELLERIDLSLDEDGKPNAVKRIWWAVEDFIGGGSNG